MYVREGPAKLSPNRKEKDAKDVYLFLFSDMLLVTKKSKDKYQVLKHMSAIGLKAVDVPEWLTGISDMLELQCVSNASDLSSALTFLCRHTGSDGGETLQFENKEQKVVIMPSALTTYPAM